MAPTDPISPPRAAHVNPKTQTRCEKELSAQGGKDNFNDPSHIGKWKLGKTIGKGAAGRVKIAKHTQTGQYAAVKILPKHTFMSSRMSISQADAKADKYASGIEREIVIMKLIDHPNIMSLYDVWEHKDVLYLILEYVEGGELFDYLVSRGKLPPSEALRYFQQIIHGVDYCHRFNICHRDLKPENLLLDADKNIKIADFGMAALEPVNRMLETSCGSPHYASPEIVAGKAYHGSASDIWSCGIILFALLTGRLPFDDDNIRVLLQKVKRGAFAMPKEIPKEAQDLISKMLVVDPEKRITMPDILLHPFFNDPVDFGSGKRVPYVEPPTLNEIARPVASAAEIPSDILANLRTLWHGVPKDEMVTALLSPEQNWEKAFYTLLVKYKEKNLETYGVDAPPTKKREHRSRNPDGSSRKSRQPSSNANANAASSTTAAADSTVNVRKPVAQHGKLEPAPVVAETVGQDSFRVQTQPTTLAAPIAEDASQHHQAGGPGGPVTVAYSPTRAAPPSPNKQSEQQPPPQQGFSAVGVLGGTPGAGNGVNRARTMMHGPRERPMSVHSPILVGASNGSPVAPTPPARAKSQRAPQRALTYQDERVPIHPPSSNAAPSPASDSYPSLVPSSATASAHPQIALHQPPPMHGLGLDVGLSSSITSSPVPMSPQIGQIAVPALQDPALQKFLQDMASQITALHETISRNNSPSASPNLPHQELFEQQQQQLPSPNESSSPYALTDPRLSNGTGSQAVQQQTVPRPPLRNASLNGRSDNRKSQLGPGGGGSAMKQKGKPTPLNLDRSPVSPYVSSFLSPALSPMTMTSAPPSPLLSPGSGFDNKQSWFSKMFNWSPATATLISSTAPDVTRSECGNVLRSMGVTVALEEGGGWGTLRCHVDRIQDLSGQVVSKPVRFRVEFTPQFDSGLPSPALNDGYFTGAPNSPRPTTVTHFTLTQEKGALSAFKVVCARLRQEWSLSEIHSPAMQAGSRFSQAQNSPALPPFREAQTTW